MLIRPLYPLVVVMALAAGCSTPTPQASPGPPPSPSPSATAATPASPPTGPPPPPAIDPATWATWALLDRATDTITAAGGPAGTSTTESMIKVGVVAQYLADIEGTRKPVAADEMDLMRRAIRDSDNEATESLYRRHGGDQLLRRLITNCGLRDTTTKPAWWSETQMTAADAARMGACIAAGRVAGAEWTTWILGEMRSVRGVGLFGIIEARPLDAGRPLAIKNGWSIRDDGWHVNCLAVSTWWTLAVMLRFPVGTPMDVDGRQYRDLGYGAAMCRRIAASVIPAEPSPEPVSTGGRTT